MPVLALHRSFFCDASVTSSMEEVAYWMFYWCDGGLKFVLFEVLYSLGSMVFDGICTFLAFRTPSGGEGVRFWVGPTEVSTNSDDPLCFGLKHRQHPAARFRGEPFGFTQRLYLRPLKRRKSLKSLKTSKKTH